MTKEPTKAQANRLASEIHRRTGMALAYSEAANILCITMAESPRPRIEITDEMVTRDMLDRNCPVLDSITERKRTRERLDRILNGPTEPDEPLPQVTREMEDAGLKALYGTEELGPREEVYRSEFKCAFLAAWKVMKGMKS